jgi:hypothetical protein
MRDLFRAKGLIKWWANQFWEIGDTSFAYCYPID